MYSQQNKRNVTMIDDLPELDDLESNPNMNGHQEYSNTYDQPIGDHGQFQKFIRPRMGSPPTNSGMGPYQQPPTYNQQPEYENHQEVYEKQMRNLYDSPTCLEIHDHVQQCPICSRFFKNDNTPYIIAIVILAIICILLLKKVLNV
jgi:hypothetical protein